VASSSGKSNLCFIRPHGLLLAHKDRLTLSAFLCSYMRRPVWYYTDYPRQHQHPLQHHAYSHIICPPGSRLFQGQQLTLSLASDFPGHLRSDSSSRLSLASEREHFLEMKPLLVFIHIEWEANGLVGTFHVNTRGSHRTVTWRRLIVISSNTRRPPYCHILVLFHRYIKPACQACISTSPLSSATWVRTPTTI
jgi:hypothetical protein